jgi:hypothetical protein
MALKFEDDDDIEGRRMKSISFACNATYLAEKLSKLYTYVSKSLKIYKCIFKNMVINYKPRS